jgi:hypothetical protein
VKSGSKSASSGETPSFRIQSKAPSSARAIIEDRRILVDARRFRFILAEFKSKVVNHQRPFFALQVFERDTGIDSIWVKSGSKSAT